MHIDLFLATLPLMLKGMLGVFAVIFVLMLSVYLLNAWTRQGKD